MENILLKYMSNRVVEESQDSNKQLPIITISREYGCYAKEIASLLAEELNYRLKDKSVKPWSVISKEILERAAEEMKLRPQKISHVFCAEDNSILADIINSFSTASNLNDTNIKKTITSVIRAYANEGNVIIIGRAGCVITKNYPKTFHIKIGAPIEWRIKHISDFHGISESKARERVIETDKRRATFMSYFQGNRPELELFDVVFNRKTLSSIEIVEAIIKIMEARGLI